MNIRRSVASRHINQNPAPGRPERKQPPKQVKPLATSLSLGLRGTWIGGINHDSVSGGWLDRVGGLLQRLRRDDTVDIWQGDVSDWSHMERKILRESVPVRIVWNADSTFEASNAEVSMNDKPFSAI